MEKNILVYVGIPGSGKSTEAKKQVKQGNAVRINKDDLRDAHFPDTKHSKTREIAVLELRDYLVNASLDRYNIKNVIIDDTNLHPKHFERMEVIAREREILYGEKVNVHRVWFPDSENVDLCHKRNEQRGRTVPYSVIENMYAQYKKLRMQEDGDAWPLRNIMGTDAVIFDIDGTLAHRSGRSPFDWERVDEDRIDLYTIDLLKMYQNAGYHIILLSGRDSCCEIKTRQWLRVQAGISYNQLYMRPKDNTEKDYIVKERLYREKVLPNYNVSVVVDDRAQCVRLWRALGLKCFQVEPGLF